MEKVLLTNYFNIVSSKQIDKMRLDIADINDVDALPFLSRSERDNGISDYCYPIEDKINEGGVITIALDGSTGATFYQYHRFLSGQNIWILSPKPDKIARFDMKVALFMVASIRKAVSHYTYNLSLTKARLSNIQVFFPLCEDKSLDIAFIEDKMKQIKHIELLNEILDERYQICL